MEWDVYTEAIFSFFATAEWKIVLCQWQIAAIQLARIFDIWYSQNAVISPTNSIALQFKAISWINAAVDVKENCEFSAKPNFICYFCTESVHSLQAIQVQYARSQLSRGRQRNRPCSKYRSYQFKFRYLYLHAKRTTQTKQNRWHFLYIYVCIHFQREMVAGVLTFIDVSVTHRNVYIIIRLTQEKNGNKWIDLYGIYFGEKWFRWLT